MDGSRVSEIEPCKISILHTRNWLRINKVRMFCQLLELRWEEVSLIKVAEKKVILPPPFMHK